MANAKAYAKKVWADLKFLYKQGFWPQNETHIVKQLDCQTCCIWI
jgi:hypothetical protein